MQIVIDIDEDTYRYMQSRCKYQNKGDKGLSKFVEAGVAIKNGTPLPKGHGRLIDEQDAIDALSVMFSGNDEILNDALECIEQLPEVIEADGGSEE